MNATEERPATARKARTRTAPVKDQQIVTVVTASTRRRLDAHSANTEQTMAEIMRRALSEYLERNGVVDPGEPTGSEG